MTSRRALLTAGAAGLAAAAGFEETVRHAAGNAVVAPRALAPEAWVDPSTGAVVANPQQFMAHVAWPGGACGGGARLRVDRSSGAVLRITGNPYHPLAADPPLQAAATLREALAALSRHGAGGPGQPATVGTGASVPAERLRTPLKRVGPRGGGQWQPVGFAQVVRDVVEGGDLFGEGRVDGLRALRGGGAGVLLLAGQENGRGGFARAFLDAYGGGAIRVQQPPLAPPDLHDAEFVLLFGGTLPGGAAGRQIALRRAAGQLVTVLADAVLGPADNVAVGAQSRWLPVRPGTEEHLARAMLRRLGGPAGAPPEADAAVVCGVSAAEIAALADAFAVHGRRAACVAAGPLGAGAAAAVQALNALAGHRAPAPAPAAGAAPGALFLWGCAWAPAATAPLVVAVGTAVDAATRQADYIVPDTLPFESWGCAGLPGVGVGTSWPVQPPPPDVGMERLLIACGHALGLAMPDDEAAWYLRAIAALAATAPAMPGIGDDDLTLSGLDRIRPLLEAAPAWRQAGFVLARGGRFDGVGEVAPVEAYDDPPPAAAGAPDWPLVLAVRPPLLQGGAARVTLHTDDAAALHLRNGATVTVETPSGRATGRLLVRSGIMRGVVATTAALRDGAPARVVRAKG